MHQGITNTDNRKEWPLSVLRKVLDELMNETPKDLLSKSVYKKLTSDRRRYYRDI